MTTDKLDMELAQVDYSEFSAVKKTLLATLLKKHRQDNFKGFKTFAQELAESKLTFEELDCVAAAGNPALNINPDKNFYPIKK